MDFKTLIIKNRKKINLTQTALAEKINVSKTTISNWETGKTKISLSDQEILKNICNVLSLSKEDIISAISNNSTQEEKVEISSEIKKFIPENLLTFHLDENEIKLFMVIGIENNFEKPFRDIVKEVKTFNYLQIIPNPIILSAIIEQLCKDIELLNCNDISSSMLYNYIIISKKTSINIKDIVTMMGISFFVRKKILSYKIFEDMYNDKTINDFINMVCKKNIFYVKQKNLSFNDFNEAYTCYCGTPHFSDNCSEKNKNLLKKCFGDINKDKYDSFCNNAGIRTVYMISPNKEILEKTRSSVLEEKLLSIRGEKLSNDITYKFLPQDNILLIAVHCQNNKINEILEKSFFITYEDVSPFATAEYNLKKTQYDNDYKEWETNMKEIKKLQQIYKDKERFPDLEEPIPPALPKGELLAKPSRLMNNLISDYIKYINTSSPDIKEKKTSNKSKNYRDALVPYLNTEVIISGMYSGIHKDTGLLIKDIYLGDKYICDHLWLYNFSDCNLVIKPGSDISVSATVAEYTTLDGCVNIGVKSVRWESLKQSPS